MFLFEYLEIHYKNSVAHIRLLFLILSVLGLVSLPKCEVAH